MFLLLSISIYICLSISLVETPSLATSTSTSPSAPSGSVSSDSGITLASRVYVSMGAAKVQCDDVHFITPQVIGIADGMYCTCSVLDTSSYKERIFFSLFFNFFDV